MKVSHSHFSGNWTQLIVFPFLSPILSTSIFRGIGHALGCDLILIESARETQRSPSQKPFLPSNSFCSNNFIGGGAACARANFRFGWRERQFSLNSIRGATFAIIYRGTKATSVSIFPSSYSPSYTFPISRDFTIIFPTMFLEIL